MAEDDDTKELDTLAASGGTATDTARTSARSGSDVPVGGPDSTPASSEPSLFDLVNDRGTTSALADVNRRKMAETERFTAAEDRALAEDRTRAQNFLDREGVGPGDLQKWDVKHEREKYRTDPIEAFGSFASVFAIAASAFTKAPMENALNGAAAAMNAVREGNEKEYDKAYQAWKDNNELAIKRHQIMHDQYVDALSLMTHDVTLGDAKLRQLAAKFGDQKIQTLLDHGYAPEVIEMIQSRAKAMEGLIKVQQESDEYSLRKASWDSWKKQNPNAKPDEQMAVFENMMGAKTDMDREFMRRYWAANPSTGDPKTDLDNFTSAWRKYNEAKYPYRGAAQAGSKNALVQALIPELQAEHPDWTPAQVFEEATRRATAASVKGPGQGTKAELVQSEYRRLLEDNPDMSKADALAEANRRAEVLTTKRTGQSATQETIDKKAAEYRRDDPSLSEADAQIKAQRFVKLSSAVPSGNRIDQLRSRVDQIKYATERVDEVENMLKKHKAITGLGGKIIGRPTEIMGNILGSNSTDYKQFERTVNELQQLMPRILTDSQGRPLGVEAGHVSSVVAGLSAGDTLQGTVRAYNELKKQLAEMKADTENRIQGGGDDSRPAPVVAPAPKTGGWTPPATDAVVQ